MNRSFIMLLVLVIFLGAGFGGSFVGGVIYGENRAENAEDLLSPRLAAGGQVANAEQGGQGRQRQGQGSAAAQEQTGPVAEGRGRGSGGLAAAPAGADGNAANSEAAAVSTETSTAAEEDFQGAANRGGAAGTVLGLEGDVLTVTSPRGELAVMLSTSTRVFQVSETGRESLAAETTVRVVGSRNPEGGIAAQSVVIVPEGVENLFGGGGGPGGRPRGQGP